MAATGPELWGKAPQIIGIRFTEKMEEPGPDRQSAWHARGASFEPRHLPVQTTSVRGFGDAPDRVIAHFGQPRLKPQGIIAAMLRTLARHVDDSRIGTVLAMPPDRVPTCRGAAATA